MQSFVQKIVIVIFVLGLCLEGFAFWKSTGITDSVGPMISMDQEQITVSIHATEEEILSDVTAWDTRDGDVTDTLVIQTTSNFIEKGVRRLTIAAFDKDNNVTKVQREIVYSDYVSPRFTLEAPLRFQTNSNYSVNNTFQVMDCLDGDLTNHVTISLQPGVDSLDTMQPGTVEMIYKVVNSAGDVVSIPATVTFYDNTDSYGIPLCLLSQYLVYLKVGDSFTPESYITGVSVNNRERTMEEMAAILAENPEATGQYTAADVQITNPVDTAVAGVYEVAYQMTGEDNRKNTVRMLVLVEE